MTQKTVEVESELPAEIRFPTQEYNRDVFYETFDNVRYMLKINLINGQQAEDTPVGVEDLIDFLGDVEWIIDSTEGLSVEYRNHDSWTAKLHTGCDAHMSTFDWRKVENKIEQIADEHAITLRKEVSMSGRGSRKASRRCVGVTYSFGTYNSNGREDLVKSENNPMSKVEWVGGNIGDREDLNESTIEIKSVETHEPTLVCRIRNFLSSLF